MHRGGDHRSTSWTHGNHIQVVAYQDIQFTKAPEILRGMKLDGLRKNEQVLEELRVKGLTAEASET